MLSGWKDFDAGDILTAADLQNYIQNQVVLHFDNTSSRDVAFSVVAPEAGMISYVDTQGFLEVYNGTSWDAINIGSPLSGGFPLPEGRAPITTGGSQIASWQQVSQAISPNYIINGAFDIWQRGTSFVNPSPGSFIADRWRWNRDGGNTGLNVTLSQQPLTPNDITSIGFGEGSHFLRTAVSNAGTSTFKVLSTRIEDVRTLANQSVTFSFWAKAAATFNFGSLVIRQNFGSGGSANADTTISGVSSVGTTWQRYTYTLTLPSISGKTIGAGSYVEIIIFFQDAATYTFDIWGVQLEAGSVATPFRRNANSIQGELAACQRYFVALGGQTNWAHSLGFAASTTSIRAMIPIPVTMRATPTLVDATPVIRTGTSGLTPSSTTMQVTQPSAGVQVSYAVTGAVANNPAIINHDATASLSAEL